MTFTFEEFKKLLKSDRSVRRFVESERISEDFLKELVALLPYCSSARNAQPLKYRLVTDAGECAALFPALAWAGYYKDWAGPEAGERPAAYLVQCLDTELGAIADVDSGIQLQALTLGAAAEGISCCCIKAFDARMAAEVLALPEGMKPLLVIALGKAAEQVKIVSIENGDFRYFRDADDTQCVPKRSAESLIINK